MFLNNTGKWQNKWVRLTLILDSAPCVHRKQNGALYSLIQFHILNLKTKTQKHQKILLKQLRLHLPPSSFTAFISGQGNGLYHFKKLLCILLYCFYTVFFKGSSILLKYCRSEQRFYFMNRIALKYLVPILFNSN